MHRIPFVCAGAAALLGMAVILKDSLRFVSLMLAGEKSGPGQGHTDAALALVRTLFIVSQVSFVSLFSKICAGGAAAGPR